MAPAVSRAARPDGLPWELQFHTSASLVAQKEGRPFYEEMRKVETPPARKRALFDKLVDEIKRTGLYPPIIVRPVGDRYQILDGHHRVQALRQLGIDHAQAVAWQADDTQALLLLATLNRLSGDDDPRKRSALLAQLTRSIDIDELSRRLPEDRARIKKLLTLNADPPSPRVPTPVEEMPVCLHFFLLPAQRTAVERRLREAGGPREAALMKLLSIQEPATDA